MNCVDSIYLWCSQKYQLHIYWWDWACSVLVLESETTKLLLFKGQVTHLLGREASRRDITAPQSSLHPSINDVLSHSQTSDIKLITFWEKPSLLFYCQESANTGGSSLHLAERKVFCCYQLQLVKWKIIHKEVKACPHGISGSSCSFVLLPEYRLTERRHPEGLL